MIRFLLVFLAILGALLFVNWLLKEDPKKIARILKRSLLWIAVGVILLLVVTGRAHWLFAMFAALVPLFHRLVSLLRFVPILSQLYTYYQNAQAASAGTVGGGQRSRVASKYLDMTLDHDSGDMDGEVLSGPYGGKRLSELSLNELLELLVHYQGDDADSRALLQAYLDRHHPDWRSSYQGDDAGASAPSSGNGALTPEEARQILGVSASASKEEIVQAHRRLMQKLHPDRGGSDYLAAKINQAKDLLLGD